MLNFRYLSLTLAFYHLFLQFAYRSVKISSHIAPLSLSYCHSGRCKTAPDLPLSWSTPVMTTAPQELLAPVCPSGLCCCSPSAAGDSRKRRYSRNWMHTVWVAWQKEATCCLLSGKPFFIGHLRKNYSMMNSRRSMLVNGTFNSCFMQGLVDA